MKEVKTITIENVTVAKHFSGEKPYLVYHIPENMDGRLLELFIINNKEVLNEFRNND